MQRKLVLKEDEMMIFLLNKENMNKTIVRKGNLSIPRIDKLTYPILKYEKKEAADLMIKIMTMMLRVQKYPEAWREGKVVMLLKPCDESEKDKPGNWKPITLTCILYRIIFGKIAEYFQFVHKRKTHDGNGIISQEQKGFIKNINACCEHSTKVNYLIADACRRRKKLYLAALY
jgi:hypothetical protein